MASSRWCTRRIGQDSPDRPWNGKRTFSSLATTICATGSASRTGTAKPTACAAGCKLARHSGNFLEETTSGFWHSAIIVYRTLIRFTGTATPCFPTGPTFGTRGGDDLCGSRKSARLHRRMGYICTFDRFLDDPGPAKLPLSPARYTISTRVLPSFWCQQMASLFVLIFRFTVDTFSPHPPWRVGGIAMAFSLTIFSCL